MDGRQVRGILEAAKSESRGVNIGFRALAGPEAVAGLCASWLVMREALKDIIEACQEAEMSGKDRAEYALRLARTALDSAEGGDQAVSQAQGE